MKTFIRTLTIIFTLGLSACSLGAAPTDTPKGTLSNSELGVVFVTADWCGDCREIQSKIKTIRATHTFDNTQFATIDYSSKDLEAFYANTRALGVERAFKGLMGEDIKTGLVLVDIDRQTIYGNLQSSNSNPEIVKLINHFARVARRS